MKASLRSVRIAPKKAQLIAKMVRGKSIPDAIASLERTNKKAARIIEELVKSAVSNARNNENQQPDALRILSLTVNKAQAYRRGVPMARGRVRPMQKFLSHINLELGINLETEEKKKSPKSSSQATKTPVKSTGTSAKSAAKSTKSASAKADTTASHSTSARTNAKK